MWWIWAFPSCATSSDREEVFKLGLCGKITAGGREGQKLPQGGIINCGRRLGRNEREELAVTDMFMKLPQSWAKWHIDHRYLKAVWRAMPCGLIPRCGWRILGAVVVPPLHYGHPEQPTRVVSCHTYLACWG